MSRSAKPLDKCHVKSADKHNFSSVLLWDLKNVENITTAVNAIYCSSVIEIKKKRLSVFFVHSLKRNFFLVGICREERCMQK